MDVVNITVNFDMFSGSTLRAFVSEYPRPVEIRPKQYVEELTFKCCLLLLIAHGYFRINCF